MSTTQEITARAEQWLRRVTHDGESCPAVMAEGEVCLQCEVNSEGAAIIHDLLAEVQRLGGERDAFLRAFDADRRVSLPDLFEALDKVRPTC